MTHVGLKVFINPFDAEIGTFQDHCCNTMAADALAPCIARSSAGMVLTTKNSKAFVFHMNVLQYQCYLKW